MAPDPCNSDQQEKQNSNFSSRSWRRPCQMAVEWHLPFLMLLAFNISNSIWFVESSNSPMVWCIARGISSNSTGPLGHGVQNYPGSSNAIWGLLSNWRLSHEGRGLNFLLSNCQDRQAQSSGTSINQPRKHRFSRHQKVSGFWAICNFVSDLIFNFKSIGWSLRECRWSMIKDRRIILPKSQVASACIIWWLS